MTVGVLVTDDGPHSPADWARATADQIVDISAEAEETKIREAERFRGQLVALLTHHHERVQSSESARLADSARYAEPLDPSEYVDVPVREIVDLASGYSFADHFANPETQQYLRDVLASHFATSMNIERRWHAHRNESEAGIAYLAAAQSV